MLWLSDFTYVAIWQGFIYVAFVIDAYASRSVGWRVSRTERAGFVLNALEQALHERRPVQGSGLVHHLNPPNMSLSSTRNAPPKQTWSLPSAPWTNSYSYDNALAETINGLYKADVIHRRGHWRSFETVEFATLEWVDWFNNLRLLELTSNIPPAEAEARYHAMLKEPAMAALTQTKWPPKNPRRFRSPGTLA